MGFQGGGRHFSALIYFNLSLQQTAGHWRCATSDRVRYRTSGADYAGTSAWNLMTSTYEILDRRKSLCGVSLRVLACTLGWRTRWVKIVDRTVKDWENLCVR